MKRYPKVFVPALCALVLSSCSERDASLVDVGRGTSLAFAPQFVLLGGSQSAADINAIRLTARSVPANTVVATADTTVNPNDAEWDLRLSVPPDAGTVIVLIELINRGPGGETVEWSGETAPIRVQAGVTNTPAAVQLFQGPPINLQVTSVTIVPDGITLAEGTTRALAATVVPAGVVHWSSLDPAVATVDAGGTVHANRNGSARIVAAAGPRADTIVVTATAVVASIALSPDTLLITALGGQGGFTVSARDPRGGEVPGAAITWTVANPAVAAHIGNGQLRAVANGVTQITATSAANPAVFANATLLVSQRGGNITLAPASAGISSIGGTQQFTATVTDPNGNPMPTPHIQWRSANAAVATVDANGLATARSAGSTEIIAVVNAGAPDSAVARASLSVSQTVASIDVDPNDTTLASVRDTVALRAKALDAGGNIVPDVVITWSSSNASIATVADNGVVTGLNNGTATIIAAAGGARATVSITVAQTAVSASVTPASDTIGVAATTQLVATARDANDFAVAGAAFTWTSSDTAVAVVSATGVVTGRHAGTAIITAQSGSATATATITVEGAAELPNLRVISLSTDPVNPLVEGGPVIVTLHVQNPGTIATPASAVLFTLLDGAPPHGVLNSAVLPLRALVAGEILVLQDTFELVGTSELPDSVRIGAILDPDNTLAESDETDNTIQTETKVIQFVPHTWTGAAGNDWHNALNWQPATVPGSRSAVTIPSGLGTYPVLSQNADIASLTQHEGSSISLNDGVVLTVRGSVSGANIEGGTLRLSASGVTFGLQHTSNGVNANGLVSTMPTVDGTVGALMVASPVELGGYFQTNGHTEIEETGAVYVGAHEFRVESSLAVDGILDMTNADASVVVYENAAFTGGASSVGHLTAGTLTLLRYLDLSGANAFAASGTHLTVFANPTAATVTVAADPGIHFQNMRTESSPELSFVGHVLVNGDVERVAGTGQVGSDYSFTIGGDLIDLGSGWMVRTTIFTGDPQIPLLMQQHAEFTGNPVLQLGETYHIGGNVTVRDGGSLDLTGVNLEVGGNFVTASGGALLMPGGCDCASAILRVQGDVSLNGAGNIDPQMMGAGTILVGGNFTAAANSFNATSFHAVEMNDLLATGETRTITLTNPGLGAGQQHFGTLRVRRPTDLLTDIAVDGNIELDGGHPLNGLGRTATVLGDIEDTSVTCSECTIQAAVTAAPAVRTAGVKPAAPMSPRLSASVAASASTFGMYNVSNTVLAGSLQHLPEFINTNITVISDVLLASFSVVEGDVIVTGAGAQLRLGDVDEFTCVSIYLRVNHDFETRNGGTLQMECNAYLEVEGNTMFDGGSLEGKLLHGTIDAAGDFTATSSDPHSFISEGVSISLTADAALNPVQTLFLETPLTQTLSDVWVNTVGAVTLDIPNGANVYGWFNEFHENEDILITGNGILHVRAVDTCNDACWYGGFQVYNARIDNLRVIAENTELYIQYIVFGTYPTNVDQITIRNVQLSPYVAEISFLTTPADGFYHMRASDGGSEIVVNNPTPATEADGARWIAENGASIVWGAESNLFVQSITHPSVVSVGQNVSLSTMVRNDGETAIGPFRIAVRILDGDGNPVANVPPITFDVTSGLPASATLLKSLTVPISPDITWPPVIQAEVILDSLNAISESNERDNTRRTSLVTVSPAS